MEYPVKAIVLAAGKGTRLQSEKFNLPKVMREADGKPLLKYVLDALSFLHRDDIIIVVGYKKETVISKFKDYKFVEQSEQLGTGHAVLCASSEIRGFDGAVLVCYGDMPLIRSETYKELIETHFKEENACTLLSGTSSEPLPYGRVIRDSDGSFLSVVEDRDCNEEQKKIEELNVGIYVFDSKLLLKSLSELKNNNSQKEYYLTDVPRILKSAGGKIGIHKEKLGEEIIGVNTPAQLKQVEDYLRKRKFTSE